MKHLVIALAALALVVAACSPGGGAVATVNGTDITVEEIEQLTPNEGTVAGDNFRANLQSLIITEAVFQQAAEEFDITFTEEEITAQHEEMKQQVIAQGQDYEQVLADQQMTDALVREIAHQQLVSAALDERFAGQAESISDDEVRSVYDDSPDRFTEACVKHILVATEEEATAVKTRLDAGEDFATIAGELSVDTGSGANGGDLGCQPMANADGSTYVAEFTTAIREAEIGVVTAPTESEFGFHLILVDSLSLQPFEEVEADLRTELTTTRTQEGFTDWVRQTLLDATISIEPEYGRWVTDPDPAVLAPLDETATTVAPVPTVPPPSVTPLTEAP